jgi:predicted ATPase
MLETILGRHPPAAFVEAFYDHTGGNPFFVEELLKSLLETDTLDRLIDQTRRGRAVDLAAVPRSLRDTILRRADGLEPPSIALLRYAAVLGRRFDCALLQAVAGCDEAEPLRRLRVLVAAQLIVEESADTFAFRHALTHQAVQGDLLARERRILHGEVAATMERLYAATLDAHLAELADHTFQAGVWERALVYARRAGERARDLDEPRAAVEQFSRALDAVGHLEPSWQTDGAGLYRDRGQAHELLGDFEAARSDYEMAAELAGTATDRRGEWRAALDLGLLWAGRDYSQAGAWYQRALDQARALGEPALLAHSLNRVGNWQLNLEQPLEALRLHHEALTIFHDLADQRGAAETLDLLGMTNLFRGDLLAATAAYRQAV